PVCSGGKIDSAARCALLGHGSNKERGTEHVLVSQVGNLRVGRKIHKQRAHVWSAGLICSISERVNIREQFVTQLQIFSQNRFCLLAIRPNFVVSAAAVSTKI